MGRNIGNRLRTQWLTIRDAQRKPHPAGNAVSERKYSVGEEVTLRKTDTTHTIIAFKYSMYELSELAGKYFSASDFKPPE